MSLMNIHASSKGVGMSPRKVGLVATLVRGRSVADALIILQHTPKRAAAPVAKVIASARANAVSQRADEKSLIIDQLHVTSGPRLKRFRPAAMGRALPYQKRTSHIMLTLTGVEKPKKVTKKPAAKPAEEKKEA